MNQLVKTLLRRDLIELSTLVLISALIKMTSGPSNLFLIPLGIVLIFFLFDLYKISKFKKSDDLKGLIAFESKLLRHSYGWYFLPILAATYLINQGHSPDWRVFTAVIVFYLFLYGINLKASFEILRYKS